MPGVYCIQGNKLADRLALRLFGVPVWTEANFRAKHSGNFTDLINEILKTCQITMHILKRSGDRTLLLKQKGSELRALIEFSPQAYSKKLEIVDITESFLSGCPAFADIF